MYDFISVVFAESIAAGDSLDLSVKKDESFSDGSMARKAHSNNDANTYILPSSINAESNGNREDKKVTYSAQETVMVPEQCEPRNLVDIYIMADDTTSPVPKASAVPHYWPMSSGFSTSPSVGESAAEPALHSSVPDTANKREELADKSTDVKMTISSPTSTSNANPFPSLSRTRPDPISKKPPVLSRLSQQLPEHSRSLDEAPSRWSVNPAALPDNRSKRSPKLNLAARFASTTPIIASEATGGESDAHPPPDYSSSIVQNNIHIWPLPASGGNNSSAQDSPTGIGKNLETLDASVPVDDSHVISPQPSLARQSVTTPVYANVKPPPPVSKKPQLSQIPLSQRTSLPANVGVPMFKPVSVINQHQPPDSASMGLYANLSNADQHQTVSVAASESRPAVANLSSSECDKKSAAKPANVTFQDVSGSSEKIGGVKFSEQGKPTGVKLPEVPGLVARRVATPTKQLRFQHANSESQLSVPPSLIEQLTHKIGATAAEKGSDGDSFQPQSSPVPAEPVPVESSEVADDVAVTAAKESVPVDFRVERLQQLQKKMDIEFRVRVSLLHKIT